MGQLRIANKRRRRAFDRASRTAPLPPHAPARPANDRDPVELIASADIPGGGQLRLVKCGEDFSIQFCSDELMGSVEHRSEDALAELARDRIGPGRGEVLIGGLGMGFTLGAALKAWDADARITVAELVPEVVEWAKGPLAHLFGADLGDPRVNIEIADVHDVIERAKGRFDAILLDVDNGSDGFMRPENDRLYCDWGLRTAMAALRDGGMLAVWSAYPDPAFAERLAAIGFKVEEVEVADTGANHGRGLHTIFLALKPAA